MPRRSNRRAGAEGPRLGERGGLEEAGLGDLFVDEVPRHQKLLPRRVTVITACRLRIALPSGHVGDGIDVHLERVARQPRGFHARSATYRSSPIGDNRTVCTCRHEPVQVPVARAHRVAQHRSPRSAHAGRSRRSRSAPTPQPIQRAPNWDKPAAGGITSVPEAL